MAIYEDYYVINSNSHIKSVTNFLCTELLKELKNDYGTLKPHISDLDTNATYCGKPCIKATLPTLFIEIEYKTSDGHYLISREVFLYQEYYPNMEALEALKEATSYGFASQVSDEINETIDAHHNSQGCMCLSSGDY